MKRRKPGLFERIRWWRIRRQLLKLTPKRTCTDCGFLAFGELEADSEMRTMLHTKGAFGFPGPVENWRCARNLWDYGLHYTEPNWDGVLSEVNFDRRSCRSFLRHSPGRSPADHFTLEKEAIDFRRKLWLGLLPLAIGLIAGWLLKR